MRVAWRVSEALCSPHRYLQKGMGWNQRQSHRGRGVGAGKSEMHAHCRERMDDG